MPEKIEAKFEIVTPMFLGDGETKRLSDTLRPASIKGALRFWWRALQWPKIRSKLLNDVAALKALHTEEAHLFGAAAKENSAVGQSSFLLQVRLQTPLTFKEINSVHPDFSSAAGARYLGYGLVEAFNGKNTQQGRLIRPCFNLAQCFTVELRSRKPLDPSVIKAIKCLGLLGGLGSRARHGLGSVALKEITGDDISIPKDKESYSNELKKLLENTQHPDCPPFSAFSNHTRIDRLLQEPSALGVLNQFGEEQMRYRSWGHDGEVLGKPSEKNFSDDHCWYKTKDKRSFKIEKFHPERVVFGLPHNYSQQVQVTTEDNSRRASPLFFHVHKLSDGDFIGVSVLMKAAFLPTGQKIRAAGNLIPQNINWQILDRFLERFQYKEKIQ